MPDWRGTWSEAEATAYLEAATVPIRLACHTANGGLWMLSLWFRYRDGALHCATGADADVVEYLEADPGVAFEVSDNEPHSARCEPERNRESVFERVDASGGAARPR